MNYIKRIFKEKRIIAVMMILIGIILIVFPIESLSVGSTIISIIVSVICLSNLVYFFIDKEPKEKIDTLYFILCLIGLGLGIYTFIKPTWLITALNIIVGLVLIFNVIYNMIYLFKHSVKNSLWWVIFGINILIFILGIISIVNPLRIASIIIRLEGISLIIDGVMYYIILKNLFIKLKMD